MRRLCFIVLFSVFALTGYAKPMMFFGIELGKPLNLPMCEHKDHDKTLEKQMCAWEDRPDYQLD